MIDPPGESELLRHIAERSAGLAAVFGEVVVGPGDDCAVVAVGRGHRAPGTGQRAPSSEQKTLLLVTVDQLVSGRHFEQGTEIDLIARKAVARSISDIAAMGGRPAWGLATGLLPDRYADGDALFDAMAVWARHWGAPLIGGDIAFGPGPLSLTVTVAGWMEEGSTPLLRSGAQVNDEIWLTGQIGGSLASGWHLRFDPRIEAGAAAARSGRVRAMIDLSDGLGRDATRVGAASGVVLEIEAARLPISHRCGSWREAVGEGEDYELLICARPTHPEVGGAPFEADPTLIGPVGRVRACAEGERPGAVIVDPYGVSHDAAELGWDHGA